MATLSSPVVKAVPASSPTNTFSFPLLVIELPALTPILTLDVPAEAVIKSAPSSNVVSPDIVNVPFKSTAVAVRSISSVAPKLSTVALDPCINWLASLNISLFVLFNVSPLPSVCVKVVSPSAPKLSTALSEISLKSSPTDKSAAIPAPPATVNAPVVEFVEAAPLPAPSK